MALNPRYRDGLLALATLAALVAAASATGTAGRLADPVAAAAGIGGALAIEAALLARPELTRALWERPAVRAASVAAALAAGGAAAIARVPVGIAALAWGLLAYLALLAVVIAGWNPVGRLVGRRET